MSEKNYCRFCCRDSCDCTPEDLARYDKVVELRKRRAERDRAANSRTDEAALREAFEAGLLSGLAGNLWTTEEVAQKFDEWKRGKG